MLIRENQNLYQYISDIKQFNRSANGSQISTSKWSNANEPYGSSFDKRVAEVVKDQSQMNGAVPCNMNSNANKTSQMYNIHNSMQNNTHNTGNSQKS